MERIVRTVNLIVAILLLFAGIGMTTAYMIVPGSLLAQLIIGAVLISVCGVNIVVAGVISTGSG